MTLIVERLSHAEAFEKLVPEWEALDARLTPRTPFTSPIWNQIWWKYLARRESLRNDEFFVHAVRDSGRLVEQLEVFAGGHGPVVVPGDDRRLALA